MGVINRQFRVGIPLAGVAFAAVMLVSPRVLAQAGTEPPAIRVSGAGSRTYVLVSGMVGGVAGLRRIERELVERGNRVISINPYQLLLDSVDVSFHALARRVDAELAARHVRSATFVGHSHGGAVALRVAANSPGRVDALYLLDGGAMATNRSAVLASSLRLVPIIMKIPLMRRFVRKRFLDGVRENSASTAWLDAETAALYVEPFLDNISRVVAMAGRLGDAAEPEPVSAVLARVRAPITLVLAGVRRPAGPTEEELAALAPLGRQVRTETVRGAGHFVHEEAPTDVVRIIYGEQRAMGGGSVAVVRR